MLDMMRQMVGEVQDLTHERWEPQDETSLQAFRDKWRLKSSDFNTTLSSACEYIIHNLLPMAEIRQFSTIVSLMQHLPYFNNFAWSIFHLNSFIISCVFLIQMMPGGWVLHVVCFERYRSHTSTR